MMTPTEPINAGNNPVPVPSTVLDRDVLGSFDKVKSEDGSHILIELIDMYLDGTRRRLTAIREAFADNDKLALKREAHTLKGSSSTLGLRGISHTCQETEEYCSNSTGCADLLLESLEAQFAEAEPVLIAERNRLLLL